MSNWNLGSKEYENDYSTDAPPPGEHELKVIKAEIKDTKAGTGTYLNVQFGVKGYGSMFYKFNITNPSELTQTIGRKQLRSMLLAMGMTPDQVAKFGPQNIMELEGAECIAKIKYGEDKGYGPELKINVFKAKNFSTTAETKPSTAQSSGAKSPF